MNEQCDCKLVLVSTSDNSSHKILMKVSTLNIKRWKKRLITNSQYGKALQGITVFAISVSEQDTYPYSNDHKFHIAEVGSSSLCEQSKANHFFLDVTFNLTDNTYSPYTKPNSTLLYIHNLSNHPPSIIQKIPEGINRQLSSIFIRQEVIRSRCTIIPESTV